ncbi:SAM hydrolase/SAM-dependent halogenase family protein [Pallidibacillus pasinlerensis]|uniref:S-adenosyl-l-methionine hydroxide adenosyltransferase family protein n=1 Tax=Pallidibacillus pasinlerensis TaxID=2703818 RepID=A0ABX0A512_9BACI|nr:S-adenosyl-l-methionine hydroxide adenosyltransferase family protein [Pallidibacillus pasinlerensis]NCU17355.1 S-adenosyl-l-methionine hydroxide adenosyltransferase family protein [Pallidibacillus pasinlerensis]
MNRPIVFQTDFGRSDGAVSAMYGVALSVNPTLQIYDLTHDIPQFNIWDASYRLYQTINYWPAETVFVSVVDPGVGSNRKSVVAKTKFNNYVITPDNGTLTHLINEIGITKAWVIDEEKNRLPNSGVSYTFHGRDIFAYTGARIASGVIKLEDVGEEVPIEQLVKLRIPKVQSENGTIIGNIDILDIRFGNLWTNINYDLFKELKVSFGDVFEVTIENGSRQVYKSRMSFVRTFAETHLGDPLLFVNSLDKIGVAINQGSFANAYGIKSGVKWRICLRPL